VLCAWGRVLCARWHLQLSHMSSDAHAHVSTVMHVSRPKRPCRRTKNSSGARMTKSLRFVSSFYLCFPLRSGGASMTKSRRCAGTRE
jgi:hypothetical protein